MHNQTIDTDFKTELHTLLATTARKAIVPGITPSEAVASTILGALDVVAEALARNMQPDMSSEAVDMMVLDLAAEFAQSFRAAYTGADTARGLVN